MIDDKFVTGKGHGVRYNVDRLRYDLVEPNAHRDMVDVLTYGAKKYSDDNWKNGFSWRSVIASLKRHLAAIELGEDYDSETGKLHIAHLACNAHFLNAFYHIFPQGDDRPKKFLKLPKIGCDIDGIFADFTSAWNKLYPEISETPNSWRLDRKIIQRIDEMRLNNTLDDFYLNIEALISPNDLPFEPECYITSRPVSTEITEAWLDKHNFPRSKVYTVGLRESKVDLAKKANIDIFIDDSYDNFVELNNNGIFTYLYTAPWNVRYDVGHMRINSLSDIRLFQ